MLASASDDGTIRIWGTESEMKAEQERKNKAKELNDQVSLGGHVQVGKKNQRSSCKQRPMYSLKIYGSVVVLKAIVRHISVLAV